MSLLGAKSRVPLDSKLLLHALRLLRFARKDIPRGDAYPTRVNGYNPSARRIRNEPAGTVPLDARLILGVQTGISLGRADENGHSGHLFAEPFTLRFPPLLIAYAPTGGFKYDDLSVFAKRFSIDLVGCYRDILTCYLFWRDYGSQNVIFSFKKT